MHAPSQNEAQRIVSLWFPHLAAERIFRRSSAFGGSAIRYIVKSLVPHVDIAELRIPLAIGVLDLQLGEDRLLTAGDLATAVMASSAVPGFFPPVEMGGLLL